MRDLPSKKPLTRRDTANVNKCQFCNKHLSSERALENHLQSVHSRALRAISSRNAETVLPKSKAVVKPTQAAKEEKSEVQMDKQVESDEFRDAEVKVGEDVQESSEEEEPLRDSVKTVFKCPKCTKVFNVCFLAMKHIQSMHCVNVKGHKVDPTSKDIIQPISIEKCTKCDQIIDPAQPHTCAYLFYDCLACDEMITGLASFYGHIAKHHAEGVESFYFPMRADFLRWKEDVEKQTQCKHLQEPHGAKVVYRCNHTKPNPNKNIHKMKLCPSIIIEQNFDDAVQVKHYWIHGHPTHPYKLNDKYQMFSLASLLRNAENYDEMPKTSEKATFLEFRKLMEAILVDARKLDDNRLKILMKKALEMTVFLTSNNKNIVTYKSEKNLTDADISKELSNVVEKRKSTEPINNSVSKRTRSKNVSFDTQKNGKSPIILNAFLSAESKITNVLKEWDSEDDKGNKKNSDDSDIEFKLHKESGTAQTYARNSISSMSPTSFNDSYKDFVDKNFILRQTNKSKKRGQAYKNIVKTKMGQFKPSLSPKSPNLSPKSLILSTKSANLVPKSPNLVPKSPNLSTKSANLVPKSPNLAPKSPNLAPKSPNLSQKSPNLASKSPNLSKSPKSKGPTRNISKIEDIQYEVQEQENDCNILILKI